MLGGTSSYAAIAAHRLGAKVGMISAMGDDAPPLDALSDITVRKIVGKSTVAFENQYQNGVRHQKWLSESRSILPEDIPISWRATPIIHLAPIAQELSPQLCAEFPDSLVGATVQGWLRGRDADHNVIFCEHPGFWGNIGYLDVLIASLSDFWDDRKALLRAMASVPLGVETLGVDGCAIYEHGRRTHIPVTSQPEVDPTGAGDIFAASFLLEFAHSGNSMEAAQFANACASLSVGQVGVCGVPSRSQVEQHYFAMYG